MSRTGLLVVVALVGTIGFSSQASYGALAAQAGGSGLSGTLSKNKAIRKQQLICDPDEPTGGSISVLYNPAIVSLSGLNFGPGYTGSGLIEIDNGDGTSLIGIDAFLEQPVGTETGYVQVFFNEPTIVTAVPGVGVGAAPLHGQINPDPGFLVIDNDGPTAVDTHSLFFDYLDEVSDSTVATYTIYADSGARGSQADLLNGSGENGFYSIPFNQIAPATVSGSLDTVPVPPAVWIGGMTMLGILVAGKLRQRQVA